MSLIKVEQYNDTISIVTLNRPESKNALNRELLSELESALTENTARVLIITGTGNVFCAGADLKERLNMTPEEANATSLNIGAKIKTLEDSDAITIAAMNGGAYGGGLELALACDFRIAVPEAKIGLTETSLGIIPGAGGTQRLTRLIGPSKSKQLIFTAEPITAQAAMDLGIIDEVSTDIIADALALAQRIAKNAPIALSAAKKAINKAQDLSIEDGLKYERTCYDLTLNTEDRMEGLRAFKEKRKPIYKGK